MNKISLDLFRELGERVSIITSDVDVVMCPRLSKEIMATLHWLLRSLHTLRVPLPSASQELERQALARA